MTFPAQGISEEKEKKRERNRGKVCTVCVMRNHQPWDRPGGVAAGWYTENRPLWPPLPLPAVAVGENHLGVTQTRDLATMGKSIPRPGRNLWSATAVADGDVEKTALGLGWFGSDCTRKVRLFVFLVDPHILEFRLG